jgi:hypothetical protein
MDNGSLTSKHDSPLRNLHLLQRIEGQGRCIEGGQDLVKFSKVFNIKKPKFQQRQLAAS